MFVRVTNSIFYGETACSKSYWRNSKLMHSVSHSTGTEAPYCRTYLYPSSLTDYRCASTPVSQPQVIEFTYEGETNPDFVTSVWLDETITTSSESTTTTSSSPIIPTSTSPVPQPTHHSKSNTNIGAIVGGVVGGVALIALIALGALFLRRHKKNSEPTPPVSHPPQATPQPQIMTPETKYNPPYSPAQSSWQQPVVSPITNPASPVSHTSWHEPPPQVAPAYEIAGPESRERDIIHEMDSDMPKKA